MKSAYLLKRLGDDRHIVLAQQSSIEAIIRPDNIFNPAHIKLSQLLLLLDIEENDRRGRDEEQATCAAKVDVSRSRWRLDCLRCSVAQVLNVNRLTRLIEDGESITSDEHGGSTLATLHICWFHCASSIPWQMNEFVCSAISRGCDEDCPLRGVVG